jgi:hypothetical protein
VSGSILLGAQEVGSVFATLYRRHYGSARVQAPLPAPPPRPLYGMALLLFHLLVRHVCVGVRLQLRGTLNRRVQRRGVWKRAARRDTSRGGTSQSTREPPFTQVMVDFSSGG